MEAIDLIRQSVVKDSNIFTILGSRRKGKTGTGFWIFENLVNLTGKNGVVVGKIHSEAVKILKEKEYLIVGDISDVPHNSIAIIDEANSSHNARRSMKQSNVDMGEEIRKAGQNGITMIWITHNSREIDLNVVGHTDILIIKKPSMLQKKTERSYMRGFIKTAEASLKEVEDLEKDVRAFAYVFSDLYTGRINTNLPTFWCDTISNMFKKEKQKTDDLFDNFFPSDLAEQINSAFKMGENRIKRGNLKKNVIISKKINL